MVRRRSAREARSMLGGRRGTQRTKCKIFGTSTGSRRINPFTRSGQSAAIIALTVAPIEWPARITGPAAVASRKRARSARKIFQSRASRGAVRSDCLHKTARIGLILTKHHERVAKPMLYQPPIS